MNGQPNSSQFGSFGAPPPAQSGLRHLAPWVKVVAGGGVAAAVAFYALQIGLPDGWRPSSVAGDAAGDTVRHEIEAMKEAKIDMERRIADATAQANAKAAADIIAIQKAADERTASLSTVSAAAGLTDVLCLGAQVVSALTQPQGFARSSSDDFYYAAQRTGAATCGRGNQIRQEVTRSQLDAIHQAAAERGAPMTNGAVSGVTQASTSSASDPYPMLPRHPTLAQVYSINESSVNFSEEGITKVKAWIALTPSDVQQHLYANLDNNPDRWNVLALRAIAYDRYVHG